VALDYVAPMLSLAAYNVLNNAQDPFYTSLKAGAFDKVRPTGTPCDEVFQCDKGMTTWAKIVMGVFVSVVGLTFALLGAYWVRLCLGERKY